MSELLPMNQAAALLVDVAMGRAPADLIIRQGAWVNVHTREIIENIDIAIAGGRIAYCGPDARPAIGAETEIFEAEGRFVAPGLIDAHMNIESAMLTASEFARAVLPHGTTSMFADPHGLANVLGWYGVRMMNDEAAGLPLNMFSKMPVCVPASPEFAAAGASIDVPDVETAMEWPNIIGLGEMMSTQLVIDGNEKMLGMIASAHAANRMITGHYAAEDLGRPFHGYVASGVHDDHEGMRREDAAARVRQGLGCMLRYGSAWQSVKEQVRAITEDGLDPRNFLLCTDDCHASTLLNEGHMDRAVRAAIKAGLDPVVALQLATINSAQHFQMEREIGSVAPGRRADLFVTPDLRGLEMDLVVAQGRVAARAGVLSIDIPHVPYAAACRGTVDTGRPLEDKDFAVPCEQGPTVAATVIGTIDHQARTERLIRKLPVQNGIVGLYPDGSACHVSVIERHQGSGRIASGFVAGFGYIRPCAIASTVAHDSHNLVVMGTDRTLMAQAANRLIEIGGGIAVYSAKGEEALLELPVAGLISDACAETVAAGTDAVLAAMRRMGATNANPILQMAHLTLPVVPELRLTDTGLVDVAKGCTIEVVPGQTGVSELPQMVQAAFEEGGLSLF